MRELATYSGLDTDMPLYLVNTVALPAGGIIDISFEQLDAMRNAERWEAIRRDISHRLHRVCADLTAPDFLLLVNSMVAMQVKGELRKNRFFGPQ